MPETRGWKLASDTERERLDDCRDLGIDPDRACPWCDAPAGGECRYPDSDAGRPCEAGGYVLAATPEGGATDGE